MVISVDTGNKMIKTEHYEFNSGIDVLDTIPGENDEVIEFGGKYYRTTNRRISYMEDKTEDDRYYILTLIAIAKELDTMKKEAVLAPNELIEIELLVGLPPAHYGKYRKKFQQYFQRDGKVVGFKYGGTSYQILIHEVKVYVQAYAAYCVLAARRHLTELPKVLVIDIGGFTVDYMILRYGRLEKEHVDSLESGVICLYGRIRAAIRQKYSIALDEEDIDNIILGKNTGYMQELKERVREVTIGYVTELLGTFRELGIDFRTTQTVFMGGGAILVSEIIKVVWERFKGEYFIINDPKANAKGYKLQFQMDLNVDMVLSDEINVNSFLDQINDPVLYVSLCSLKELQQKVLMLRIVYVKSFDDIGGILNMTAKQAENSYYNAIRKIRKQMGDNFG